MNAKKSPAKSVTEVPYVWLRSAMAQVIKNTTLPQEKHRLCEIMYGLKFGEIEFSTYGCNSLNAYLAGAGFVIPNYKVKVIK